MLKGIDRLIDVNDDIVRRSKNAALVGSSGIVVQETENTFKVVTRKNKSKGACVCGPALACQPRFGSYPFITSRLIPHFFFSIA